MNLSIIVVNYNTKELLKKCLDSLFRYCDREIDAGEYEIIIVDNGSSDNNFDVSIHRNKARIIKNEENLGFAKANNLGMRKAKGKYILLLNSDTVVDGATIQKMLEFAESKKNLGAATCRVELGNGMLDPACHRGFPTPWNAFCYFLGLEKLFPKINFFSGYHQYFKDLNSVHEVDAISGAFFLIPWQVVEKAGMLDEDYFMYGEDLDWCFRIREMGYSIWFNPKASITHFKKRSGRAATDAVLKRQTQRYFWETMRIFYEKHYMEKYPRLVSSFVLQILKLLS